MQSAHQPEASMHRYRRKIALNVSLLLCDICCSDFNARLMFSDCNACDEAVSECPRHSMVVAPHCLPICDLSRNLVLGPQVDEVKEEVREEWFTLSDVQRDLSRDMVLGPRLNDVKEEVRKQPSSRWMRVRQRHQEGSEGG